MYLFLLDGSLNGEGDYFISTWDEVHETFDVMGLHENLLRGIYAYGTVLFSKS
jgi:translation initiation factor 4A